MVVTKKEKIKNEFIESIKIYIDSINFYADLLEKESSLNSQQELFILNKSKKEIEEAESKMVQFQQSRDFLELDKSDQLYLVDLIEYLKQHEL